MNNRMKITDEMIRQLKIEANQAGDDMQELICIIALEGPIESFEDRFGGGGWTPTRAQREQLEEMSQAQALDACAHAIANGEG